MSTIRKHKTDFVIVCRRDNRSPKRHARLLHSLYWIARRDPVGQRRLRFKALTQRGAQ